MSLTFRKETASESNKIMDGEAIGFPTIKIHTFPLVFGMIILTSIVIAAIIGPWLVVYSYDGMDSQVRLHAPSIQHPFGTDEFGRDLLSRTLHGIRTALGLSLAAVAIAALPGVAAGLLSGYFRGWIDQIFSRLVDLWLTLPGLLLAILLITRLGPSTITTAFALGITGIPTFYRIVRAETIHLSQLEFIEASIALGAHPVSILFRHIFPNITSSLISLVALRLGMIILASSGLSFIGLGTQPPAPDLGAMVAASMDYFDPNWWLIAFPGSMIVLMILGFNLTGDGLRNILSKVQK